MTKWRTYFCPCGGAYLGNRDYLPFGKCVYCGRPIKLKKRKK